MQRYGHPKLFEETKESFVVRLRAAGMEQQFTAKKKLAVIITVILNKDKQVCRNFTLVTEQQPQLNQALLLKVNTIHNR